MYCKSFLYPEENKQNQPSRGESQVL